MALRPRTARAMMMRDRRCPKCGAKVNNQLKRCKSCAKELSYPKRFPKKKKK